MVELDLIRSIGLILGAALVFAAATRLVRIPNIVAYILAGLALGPATGLLEVTHTVELISEFGIILLLFLVGLELSLRKLRDEYGVAMVLATHNRELADRADRVLQMSEGRLQSLSPAWR